MEKAWAGPAKFDYGTKGLGGESMIIEPLRQEKKLSAYLDEKPGRVLLIWWHGIGDCIQFMSIFERLREMYPDTHFDIGIQRGLDEDVFFPEAILLDNLDGIEDGYDLTALLHFPVEVPGFTKSELCCIEELGIEPFTHYKSIHKRQESRLCAVHFNLTCLPELVMPDRDVAERIWNEVLEAGWIPIEVHFQHIYHNPVNVKFDFIDCTVRRCVPKVTTLLGLLQRCGAFIGVVSGPFHCAMATMDHSRIAYLEKDIPVARFTREPIQTFNLKDYQGGVGQWLRKI